MNMLRPTSLLLFVILAALFNDYCFAKSISVNRVALRVSYVQDAEKLQRVNVAADSDDLKHEKVAVNSVHASLTDTLVAQVVCSDNDGNVVQPTQAVLRIADESVSPPIDTVWPLTLRRNELRREVSIEFESRVDREFWRPKVPYTVQIIVGDPALDQSVIWTVTREFTLDSAHPKKDGGVFDFDMTVHKTLKAEFDTPIPGVRKEAPLLVVASFTALSIIPLLILFVVWGRMGAFSIELPPKFRQRIDLIMFEVCLIGHLLALTMFWIQWNIVTTWKVMGVLMIPSLYFGKASLEFIATRHHLEEKKKNSGKTE